MAVTLEQIKEAVIEGNAAQAVKLTKEALDSGVKPLDIFQNALIPGMTAVGEKMEAGEYFIPEVLLSARAMKSASDLVKPIIISSKTMQPVGRVALGTVKGDLHDIGKNLVGMMLEGAGFEVADLGADVSREKFVALAQEGKVQIIGLSALLTTTMKEMRNIIDGVEKLQKTNKIRVMVGGAPVTQKFADDIRADGYSPNAVGAVALAKRLIATVKN